MKRCFWCEIFGCHPLSNADRPDDEVGSKDLETGKFICDPHTKAYYEGVAARQASALKHRVEDNGEL